MTSILLNEPIFRAPPTPSECKEVDTALKIPMSFTLPIIAFGKACGSIVMLRYKGRLYGVTAAHNFFYKDCCTPYPHSEMTIPHDAKPNLKLGKVYTHPEYRASDEFDLGVVEIREPHDVAYCDELNLYTGGYSNQSAINQSMLSNHFVWIVGYPETQSKRDTDGRITGVKLTSHCTQVIAMSDDKLSLAYHKQESRIYPGSTSSVLSAVDDPYGYSGGGVWCIVNPSNEMFVPEKHVKLIGIQYSWFDKLRVCNAVGSSVISEFLERVHSGSVKPLNH